MTPGAEHFEPPLADEDASAPARNHARIRMIAVSVGTVFIVALALTLGWFQLRSEDAVRDGILTQARAHAREFSAIRTYVQGYAGIYVPASDEMTVNPSLTGIEGVIPKITAENGKEFVLQNAPCVAREISRILDEDSSEDPVHMQMFGVHALNPDNEATGFALSAYNALREGETEYHQLAERDGAHVFQYASGVSGDAKCGRCHANLVDAEPGVVGITVVEMDVTRAIDYINRSRTMTIGAIVLVVLGGILGVAFFVRHVLRDMLKAQTQVYEMARVDALTGLAARRIGMSALETEIERARREHAMLACCVADLDDFKQINDDLGHHIGDRALEAVGRAITESMRPYDTAARIGGEEFMFVVPGIDTPEAIHLCNRIRQRITAAAESVEGLDRSLTCTVGIAMLYPMSTESAREIFIRADDALRTAKRQGKDRVMLAPPPREVNGTAAPAAPEAAV